MAPLHDRRKVLLGLAAALAGVGHGRPASARRGRGRGGRDYDEHDYDSARRAVEQGETATLSAIMEEVRKIVDGELLDAELTKSELGPEYRIRMLSRSGKYIVIRVDARTKVIRKLEEQ